LRVGARVDNIDNLSINFWLIMPTSKRRSVVAMASRETLPALLPVAMPDVEKMQLVRGKVFFDRITGEVSISGLKTDGTAVRQTLTEIPGLVGRAMTVAQPMRGSSARVEQRRAAAAQLDARGLSQQEIADTLGVSQATISGDLQPRKRR
jgi:hypothetical protein